MKKGKLILKAVSWYMLITFTTTTIAWSTPSSFKTTDPADPEALAGRHRPQSTDNVIQHAMAEQKDGDTLSPQTHKPLSVDSQKTSDETIKRGALSSSRTPPAWKISIPAEYGEVKARWVGNNTHHAKSTETTNNTRYTLGTMTYAHPTVVILQDAHCHFEAQMNIAKIINHLVDNFGDHRPQTTDHRQSAFIHGQGVQEERSEQNLRESASQSRKIVVGLEGAVGTLDTSTFRSYPHHDIRNAVTRYFVSQGKLSGAEYASITSEQEIPFYGIENGDLYLDNYKAFLSIVKYRGPLTEEVEAIEEVLSQLRTILYSPELHEFEEQFIAFREERITFFEYADHLLEKAQSLTIDLFEYPNLSLFREVKDREGRVSFDVLPQEINAYLGALYSALDHRPQATDNRREKGEDASTNHESRITNHEQDRLERFTKQYNEGKVSRYEYLTYIIEQGFKYNVNLLSFANLYEYVQYIKKYTRIDKHELRFERRKLEKEIKKQLVEKGSGLENTQQVYKLLELSERLHFVRNLIQVKLFNQDLETFEKEKDSFRAKEYVDFIRKTAPKYGIPFNISLNIAYLDRIIPKVYDFYSCSRKRDVVMVEKLLNEVTSYELRVTGDEANNAQPATRNPQLAILVAGGFHTQGMREELERRGISYVVIAPRITHKQPDVDTIYLSRMLGEVDDFDMLIMDLLNVGNKETLTVLNMPVKTSFFAEMFTHYLAVKKFFGNQVGEFQEGQLAELQSEMAKQGFVLISNILSRLAEKIDDKVIEKYKNIQISHDLEKLVDISGEDVFRLNMSRVESGEDTQGDAVRTIIAALQKFMSDQTATVMVSRDKKDPQFFTISPKLEEESKQSAVGVVGRQETVSDVTTGRVRGVQEEILEQGEMIDETTEAEIIKLSDRQETIKNQLKTAQEERKNLVERLETLKKTFAKLEIRIANLEKDGDQTSEKRRAKIQQKEDEQKKNIPLLDIIRQVNEEIAALTDRLQVLTDRINSLKVELRVTGDNITATQQELNAVEQLIKDLSGQKAQFDEVIDYYNKQIMSRAEKVIQVDFFKNLTDEEALARLSRMLSQLDRKLNTPEFNALTEFLVDRSEDFRFALIRSLAQLDKESSEKINIVSRDLALRLIRETFFDISFQGQSTLWEEILPDINKHIEAGLERAHRDAVPEDLLKAALSEYQDTFQYIQKYANDLQFSEIEKEEEKREQPGLVIAKELLGEEEVEGVRSLKKSGKETAIVSLLNDFREGKFSEDIIDHLIALEEKLQAFIATLNGLEKENAGDKKLVEILKNFQEQIQAKREAALDAENPDQNAYDVYKEKLSQLQKQQEKLIALGEERLALASREPVRRQEIKDVIQRERELKNALDAEYKNLNQNFIENADIESVVDQFEETLTDFLLKQALATGFQEETSKDAYDDLKKKYDAYSSDTKRVEREADPVFDVLQTHIREIIDAFNKYPGTATIELADFPDVTINRNTLFNNDTYRTEIGNYFKRIETEADITNLIIFLLGKNGEKVKEMLTTGMFEFLLRDLFKDCPLTADHFDLIEDIINKAQIDTNSDEYKTYEQIRTRGLKRADKAIFELAERYKKALQEEDTPQIRRLREDLLRRLTPFFEESVTAPDQSADELIDKFIETSYAREVIEELMKIVQEDFGIENERGFINYYSDKGFHDFMDDYIKAKKGEKDYKVPAPKEIKAAIKKSNFYSKMRLLMTFLDDWGTALTKKDSRIEEIIKDFGIDDTQSKEYKDLVKIFKSDFLTLDGFKLEEDSQIMRESQKRIQAKDTLSGDDNNRYKAAHARLGKRIDLLLAIQEHIQKNGSISESDIKNISQRRFIHQLNQDTIALKASIVFYLTTGVGSERKSLREGQRAVINTYYRGNFAQGATALGKTAALITFASGKIRLNLQAGDQKSVVILGETKPAVDRYHNGAIAQTVKHEYFAAALDAGMVNLSEIFASHNWQDLDAALEEDGVFYLLDPEQKGFFGLDLIRMAIEVPLIAQRFLSKIDTIAIDESDRYFAMLTQYITSNPEGRPNFDADKLDTIKKLVTYLNALREENKDFIMQDIVDRAKIESKKKEKHIFVRREHKQLVVGTTEALEKDLFKRFGKGKGAIEQGAIQSIVTAYMQECGYLGQGDWTAYDNEIFVTSEFRGGERSEAKHSDKYLLAGLFVIGQREIAAEYYGTGVGFTVTEEGTFKLIKKGVGGKIHHLENEIRKRNRQIQDKEKERVIDAAAIAALKNEIESFENQKAEALQRFNLNFPQLSKLEKSLTTDSATSFFVDAKIGEHNEALRRVIDMKDLTDEKMDIDLNQKKDEEVADVAVSKAWVWIEEVNKEKRLYVQTASGAFILKGKENEKEFGLVGPGFISLNELTERGNIDIPILSNLSVRYDAKKNELIVKSKLNTPTTSATYNPEGKEFTGSEDEAIDPILHLVNKIKNLPPNTNYDDIVKAIRQFHNDILFKDKRDPDFLKSKMHHSENVGTFKEEEAFVEMLIASALELRERGLPPIFFMSNPNIYRPLREGLLKDNKYILKEIGVIIERADHLKRKMDDLSAVVGRIETAAKNAREAKDEKMLKELTGELEKFLSASLQGNIDFAKFLLWMRHDEDMSFFEFEKIYESEQAENKEKVDNEIKKILTDLTSDTLEDAIHIVRQDLIEVVKQAGEENLLTATEQEVNRVKTLKNKNGVPYLFHISTNIPPETVNTIAEIAAKTGDIPSAVLATNVDVVKQGWSTETAKFDAERLYGLRGEEMLTSRDAEKILKARLNAITSELAKEENVEKTFFYKAGEKDGQDIFEVVTVNIYGEISTARKLGEGVFIRYKDTAKKYAKIQHPFVLFADITDRDQNEVTQMRGRIARDDGDIGHIFWFFNEAKVNKTLKEILQFDENFTSLLLHSKKSYFNSLKNGFGNRDLASREFMRHQANNIYDRALEAFEKLSRLGIEGLTANEKMILNAAYHYVHNILSEPLLHKIRESIDGYVNTLLIHLRDDLTADPKSQYRSVVQKVYEQVKNPDALEKADMKAREAYMVRGFNRRTAQLLTSLDRALNSLELLEKHMKRAQTRRGTNFISEAASQDNNRVKIRSEEDADLADVCLGRLDKELNALKDYKEQIKDTGRVTRLIKEGEVINIEAGETDTGRLALYSLTDIGDILHWATSLDLVADAVREHGKPAATSQVAVKEMRRGVVRTSSQSTIRQIDKQLADEMARKEQAGEKETEDYEILRDKKDRLKALEESIIKAVNDQKQEPLNAVIKALLTTKGLDADDKTVLSLARSVRDNPDALDDILSQFDADERAMIRSIIQNLLRVDAIVSGQDMVNEYTGNLTLKGQAFYTIYTELAQRVIPPPGEPPDDDSITNLRTLTGLFGIDDEEPLAGVMNLGEKLINSKDKLINFETATRDIETVINAAEALRKSGDGQLTIDDFINVIKGDKYTPLHVRLAENLLKQQKVSQVPSDTMENYVVQQKKRYTLQKEHEDTRDERKKEAYFRKKNKFWGYRTLQLWMGLSEVRVKIGELWRKRPIFNVLGKMKDPTLAYLEKMANVTVPSDEIGTIIPYTLNLYAAQSGKSYTDIENIKKVLKDQGNRFPDMKKWKMSALLNMHNKLEEAKRGKNERAFLGRDIAKAVYEYIKAEKRNKINTKIKKVGSFIIPSTPYIAMYFFGLTGWIGYPLMVTLAFLFKDSRGGMFNIGKNIFSKIPVLKDKLSKKEGSKDKPSKADKNIIKNRYLLSTPIIFSRNYRRFLYNAFEALFAKVNDAKLKDTLLLIQADIADGRTLNRKRMRQIGDIFYKAQNVINAKIEEDAALKKAQKDFENALANYDKKLGDYWKLRDARDAVEKKAVEEQKEQVRQRMRSQKKSDDEIEEFINQIPESQWVQIATFSEPTISDYAEYRKKFTHLSSAEILAIIDTYVPDASLNPDDAQFINYVAGRASFIKNNGETSLMQAVKIGKAYNWMISILELESGLEVIPNLITINDFVDAQKRFHLTPDEVSFLAHLFDEELTSNQGENMGRFITTFGPHLETADNQTPLNYQTLKDNLFMSNKAGKSYDINVNTNSVLKSHGGTLANFLEIVEMRKDTVSLADVNELEERYALPRSVMLRLINFNFDEKILNAISSLEEELQTMKWDYFDGFVNEELSKISLKRIPLIKLFLYINVKDEKIQDRKKLYEREQLKNDIRMTAIEELLYKDTHGERKQKLIPLSNSIEIARGLSRTNDIQMKKFIMLFQNFEGNQDMIRFILNLVYSDSAFTFNRAQVTRMDEFLRNHQKLTIKEAVNLTKMRALLLQKKNINEVNLLVVRTLAQKNEKDLTDDEKEELKQEEDKQSIIDGQFNALKLNDLWSVIFEAQSSDSSQAELRELVPLLLQSFDKTVPDDFQLPTILGNANLGDINFIPEMNQQLRLPDGLSVDLQVLIDELFKKEDAGRAFDDIKDLISLLQIRLNEENSLKQQRLQPRLHKFLQAVYGLEDSLLTDKKDKEDRVTIFRKFKNPSDLAIFLRARGFERLVDAVNKIQSEGLENITVGTLKALIQEIHYVGDVTAKDPIADVLFIIFKLINPYIALSDIDMKAVHKMIYESKKDEQNCAQFIADKLIKTAHRIQSTSDLFPSRDLFGKKIKDERTSAVIANLELAKSLLGEAFTDDANNLLAKSYESRNQLGDFKKAHDDKQEREKDKQEREKKRTAVYYERVDTIMKTVSDPSQALQLLMGEIEKDPSLSTHTKLDLIQNIFIVSEGQDQGVIGKDIEYFLERIRLKEVPIAQASLKAFNEMKKTMKEQKGEFYYVLDIDMLDALFEHNPAYAQSQLEGVSTYLANVNTNTKAENKLILVSGSKLDQPDQEKVMDEIRRRFPKLSNKDFVEVVNLPLLRNQYIGKNMRFITLDANKEKFKFITHRYSEKWVISVTDSGIFVPTDVGKTDGNIHILKVLQLVDVFSRLTRHFLNPHAEFFKVKPGETTNDTFLRPMFVRATEDVANEITKKAFRIAA